jgi:hypothetical protein
MGAAFGAMAISGDYAHPVQVNGFQCRNCTDVDYAKKHIDPAHPKDGPYGVDAPPERRKDQAVSFGGALEGAATGQGRRPYTPGSTFSLSA